MKTISQVVRELTPEELRRIVIDSFKRRVAEVKDTLQNMNRVAKQYDMRATKGYQQLYATQKERLQEAGLWNPEFDEQYKDALGGNMILSKLLKVRVR